MADAMTTERDYVLGTNEEEIHRLGVQHRVWRDRVLTTWARAGIARGSRVADVGAGPGYATLDLAKIVGPTGEVVALERSARFAQHLRERATAQGAAHVHVHEVDLMCDAIPATELDATWCRWVACFVSDPDRLVRAVHGALRPGGRAIFHEYCCYSSFRMAPRKPAVESWVQEIIASWRDTGGEPDVALDLVGILPARGFTITHASPIALSARPSDPLWQWPASFISTNVDRLRSLGRVDDAWCERVRREWREAEADPGSIALMPTVLEIIAQKK